MSDMPEKETPPKRRWYQYSLRSLLIVMVLLCFLFAWGGYKIKQVEKQKEIVAWVEEKMGGDVEYEHQIDANGVWHWKEEHPPGPEWLRNLIGIDYFSSVVSVSFYNINIQLSDEKRILGDFYIIPIPDVTPLHGLPFLKSIRLHGPNRPSNQELQKLQKAFPYCEISCNVSSWCSFWCKRCNELHDTDSCPHTAEP